ncbi:MAG: DUF3047 domain-containing protein [Candidatus Binatia bacterium]
MGQSSFSPDASRRFLGLMVPVLVLVHAAAGAASELRGAGWREDFGREPVGWEIRTTPGVKPTRFRVERADGDDGRLVVEADDASAIYATHLKGVDLRRTPILRWRWRVRALPAGADGRVPERDDQAIAIYVSQGGLLRQRSVAYRWETETPVGVEGWATYGAGLVKAKWIAVRNQGDAAGEEFVIEERNIAADFKAAFGFIPDDPTISVSSNSQYTGTRGVAELDWIELVPAPDPAPE